MSAAPSPAPKARPLHFYADLLLAANKAAEPIKGVVDLHLRATDAADEAQAWEANLDVYAEQDSDRLECGFKARAASPREVVRVVVAKFFKHLCDRTDAYAAAAAGLRLLFVEDMPIPVEPA